MNKIKKVLSGFVLGAAATTMIVAGSLFAQQEKTQTYNAAVTEQQIVNTLPAFVDQSGLQNDYYFTEEVPIKFNVAVEGSSSADYIFKYYPDGTATDEAKNHFYYFDIASVSIYIDNVRLNIAAENAEKLILKSAGTVSINQQGGDQAGQSNISPEIVCFKIVYDSSATEPGVVEGSVKYDNNSYTITPAELRINQTGLLRVDVQYDLYDTTNIKGAGAGNDMQVSNIHTSQSFSYSCFFLNASDYFESTLDKDSPKLTYPGFTRTPSESAIYRYNYFYNYGTNYLPYISFDPSKVRLEVTRYYNNQTQNAVLQYNPEANTISQPDFVYQTMIMPDGSARVYFNDVGQYNFNFEFIYIVENQTDYQIYTVDYLLPDQKAYLFGAQLNFTNYQTNEYNEFKQIANKTTDSDEIEYNQILQNADVTYLYGESTGSEAFRESFLAKGANANVTPVATDQTPLRFTTNLSQLTSEEATLQVWRLGTDDWKAYDKISDITSTINESGTYFIELTYDFASHTNTSGAIDSTNGNNHFKQYFYFKIDKTAPLFTMQARGDYNEKNQTYDWKQLLSKEYTNTEEVKLTYAGFSNIFHSAVRFEYERYDFINDGFTSGTIQFNENGEYIFDQEGNYTIKVYYGKQGTAQDPSISSFTIDRQQIQDLAAYAVSTSGANNDYHISNPLNQFSTNQNFVFSWQVTKPSGAKTYGKYKYFALDYTDYYASVASDSLSLLLGSLLRNGILATDAVLNMGNAESNSWIDYSNASALIQNNNIVPASYVKSNAGLYIFQIYDQAGNSEIYAILLDNSQPYFVLETDEGYALISANHTVTSDAVLHWADNKAIQVNGFVNGDFNEKVYYNKDGKMDDEIVSALQQLKDSIKTFAASSTSDSIGYGKVGSSYLSDSDDTLLSKQTDTETYTLETGNSMNIQFSYTVHYTLVNGLYTFYYSTTNDSNYIDAATGEIVEALIFNDVPQINGNELHDANIYLYQANGQRAFYYGVPGSLNLFSTTGEAVTATEGENGLMLNGVALQATNFVDMEGTYVFLIRDASNTEGSNLSEDQKFMQYASNYQYLRVTGDQSLTQIYYKETNGQGEENLVTLTDASYANISVVNTDQNWMARSSYYNPTSIEQTLYLSFRPTIEHDDNTKTQVDQIVLSYYPYQNQIKTYYTSTGQVRYVFYKTLASTPEFTQVVYDFDENGANTQTIEEPIHITSNMTSEGRYIVTRTYVMEEGYTVDVFDYYQRNITATVDRYGVLTLPETISYSAEVKSYSLDNNQKNVTATLYENLLVLSTPQNGSLRPFDGITLKYKATEDGEELDTDNITTEDIYTNDTALRFYQFDQIYSYELYYAGNKVDASGTDVVVDDSLESIVGGDMMINMYDGIVENSGIISVAFPYYEADSILPSGDSFYTENITNWTENDNVNPTLITNKLPVKVYIPQYKYTIQNTESEVEASQDGFSKAYSNVANDYLIRFNQNDEYSVVSYYQLVASISYTSSDGKTHTFTSTTGTDGYLAFVDETGLPVEHFTQPGTYYVTITQGYNSDSNSSNNFRKNYKFAFTIQNNKPEFTITQSGAPLSTLDDEESVEVPNYYTNSKTITYSWEDLNNQYIANIDKKNIAITYYASILSTAIENVIQIDNGILSLQKENPLLLNALSYTSTTDSRGVTTNYLTIDLQALGIYQNNAGVRLTMQFEGHNDDYYKTTTKLVTVDKQASYQTVNSLIEKLQGLSSAGLTLNDSSLRTYLDVEYKQVSSAYDAAYNITTNATAGQFRNYSYLVDAAFFDELKDMANQNANQDNASNYNGGTIRAYFREIDDPYNSTYEESYSDFAAASYIDMSSSDANSYLEQNKYYQIVEEDLAGNLTFYIVYYFSVDDGTGYQPDDQYDEEGMPITIYQGITFTDHDTVKYASDAQIATGKLNLYSSTNFTLDNLNYQGDGWLIITINGETFMTSPWLDAGNVYKVSQGQIQTVSFASIFQQFASSSTPIALTLSNRFTGNFAAVNLTLLDGVQLNTTLSSSQVEEFVNVSYSNAVFPVEIEISNNNSLVFADSNNPNSLDNLTNASYVYSAGWQSANDIIVTLQDMYSRFNFAFSTLPASDSKIRYAITDNFGNTTILVHIFGQSAIQEITSEANRYEVQINDQTTDGKLVTYNISPVSLNYNFNSQLHYVKVLTWDGFSWRDALIKTDYNSSQSGSLVSYKFENLAGGDLANLKFKLRVYEVSEDQELASDDESLWVKDVYLQIYQMLPHLLDAEEEASNFVSSLRFTDNYGENVTNEILTDLTSYRVNIGGTTYTVTKSGQTFASRLTLTYSNSANFDFPFTVQVYKEDGSMGSNFVEIPSGSNLSQSGIYYFLVKYTDSLTNEYNLYRIEILDSSTEFYRVTNNGRVVEKASTYYKDSSGMEHSEYYIVNVNYNTSSSLVEIVPNDYQNITVTQIGSPISEGNNVITVAYRVTNYVDNTRPSGGVSPFDRTVFITYIPPTSSPVTEAYFTYNSAEQTDMLSQSSIVSAISIENVDSGALTIYFSQSYGLASNLINISVLKDGVAYYPQVQTTSSNGRTLSYVQLDRSGTYSISFTDTAGNQQVFASGTSMASTSLSLLFLKDVSFSMTFTDANGMQQTTDPIQKGVFNRQVSLNLINPNAYYTAQSIGSGANMITATKNGEPYSNFTYDAQTSSFTFAEPGYYSVYFSATASNGIELRHEIYNFTIVNPSESRYSLEFSPYEDYYIKSIVKDDLGDITKTADGKVPQQFKDNFQTIVVDGQEYLKNVVASFQDSFTGEGYYTITIATNQTLNRDDYTTPTEFSFSFWINTSDVPIDVSVIEGESSSNDITVSFNSERVFEAVGECTIYVANNAFHISADNLAQLGTVTVTISSAGTYFITVRSMSGNLLYSYKVVKTEPLNGWAIAAIVIGGVVAIAVVIIIIKTRKRIKVK